MRKILLLTLLISSVCVNARHISPEDARSVALEFFGTGSSQKKAPGAGLKLEAADPSVSTTDWQPYYAFNNGDNNGFVIISGDDRAPKVLGYSDKGNFDVTNMPPQLKALLDQFAKGLDSLPESSSADSSWTSMPTRSEDQGVLLETANWGQGYPYNAQCPIIDGVQAPTGCVATAMAIVMKYHNWPEKYDWGAMPIENVGSDNSSEIAQLMSDAGKAVFMNYGSAESGAHMNWTGHKLQQDFKFSPDCQFITSKNFSTEEWVRMLKNNLDSGAPVIYNGSGTGNHAFIIDGYNNDYYHINWGWDGYCNGNYALDNLRPNESQDFTTDSGMVINIVPDKSGKEYSKCFVDYGYFWTIDKSLGEAMNISVGKVEKGKPFHVVNTLFTLPAGFIGEFGLALVSQDGDIKEFLQSDSYNTWNDIENKYLDMGNGKTYYNNVINTDILPTDRIQLVAREFGDTEYKLVLGTMEWPSWVPVNGNVPRYGTVKWDIEPDIQISYNDWTAGREGIESPYIEITDNNTEIRVLRGISLSIKAIPKDDKKNGVISLVIDGPQIYGSTKCCDRNIETSVNIVGEYIVRAEWIDLRDESIELNKAGTLKNKLSEQEAKCIKSLVLSGEMDATDFWYIRDNCSGLQHLDLRDVKIKEVQSSDNRFFASQPIQPANSIPEWALTSLSKLESVILPSSITAILDNSMSGLNLRLIEIPENVEFIGLNAFYGNQRLDAVGLLNPNPIEVAECIFNETPCPRNSILYVPEGTADLYRNAEIWEDFREIKEGRLSQTILHNVSLNGLIYDCIGENACLIGYEGDPVDIIIPEKIFVDEKEFTVTAIQDRTFQECMSLESIEMPNSIKSIGTDNYLLGYVFLYCRNLKRVKLSENLIKIPAGTFFGCTQLEECKIPESVQLIGTQAFYSTGLKNIFIPQNAEPEIFGEGAFHSNQNLTEYKVDPENKCYKSIDGVLYRTNEENFILESVPGLKTGTLCVDERCTSVDGYSLESNINTIVFNKTLGEIKSNAMNGSTELKHMVLPPHAKIYPNAFWYCQYLESVTFTGSGKSYSEIFAGCTKMGTAYVVCEDGIIDLNNTSSDGFGNLNIYSQNLRPNYKYDGEGCAWIPGAACETYSAHNGMKCSEMWDYGIDRTNRLIRVKPNIEGLTIDEVIINGEIVNPVENYYYPLSSDGDPDVVVNYTLHDRHAMSTHYDAEFMASMPGTDLTVVSEITFEEENLILHQGEELQLNPSISPSFVDKNQLTWSSSDEAIATVDTIGKVTAISLGEATITATCGEVSASCTVTVIPAFELGDVNGDGETDIADVVTLVKFISGADSSSFVKEVADVNGDGEIDIADVVTLVKRISNQ